jgi:HAD superfamily hydrolase (TIGR01509 family)
MRFSHVIFDCDGVLVDTESIALAVEREIMQGFGVSLTEAQVLELFLGKSADEQGRWLSQNIGRDITADYEALHAQHMYAIFERGVPAVPGAAVALASIDLPKSVATNGVRARATLALKQTGLWNFFEGRLNAVEDVALGKPAPDIYLLAAKRAGVRPQDCAVVEDSPTGATAALAAGMTVVGFTGVAHHPHATAAQLRAVGVHTVLQDMGALHTALDWL